MTTRVAPCCSSPDPSFSGQSWGGCKTHRETPDRNSQTENGRFLLPAHPPPPRPRSRPLRRPPTDGDLSEIARRCSFGHLPTPLPSMRPRTGTTAAPRRARRAATRRPSLGAPVRPAAARPCRPVKKTSQGQWSTMRRRGPVPHGGPQETKKATRPSGQQPPRAPNTDRQLWVYSRCRRSHPPQTTACARHARACLQTRTSLLRAACARLPRAHDPSLFHPSSQCPSAPPRQTYVEDLVEHLCLSPTGGDKQHAATSIEDRQRQGDTAGRWLGGVCNERHRRITNVQLRVETERDDTRGTKQESQEEKSNNTPRRLSGTVRPKSSDILPPSHPPTLTYLPHRTRCSSITYQWVPRKE